MDETQVNLFYGSLLHDIGKVVQRSTNQKVRHSQLGKNFLADLKFNKEVMNQVAYHHYHEISHASLAVDDLSFITYIADNIASGVDRRDNDESNSQKWDKNLALEDIFNKFGVNPTKRYFQPKSLNVKEPPNFAQSNMTDFSNSIYGEIINRIKSNLMAMDYTSEYADSLLNLLEATMSYIPSSTNTEEVADISLYDHVKLTAGIAGAIHQYLIANNRHDFKKELFVQTQKFYQEKAFILASFDLSGVQDFIYTITSSGAHKQLRSRSFYLDMISEWLVDSILQKAGLTRANLMYAGGGHAYLILPNTDAMCEILDETEHSFNSFFIKEYATKLYVAFGSTSFSAAEVMAGNTPEIYRDIFRRVSQQISGKKLNRYAPETIIKLNTRGKKSSRECTTCHTVHRLLPEENKCELCDALEQFSRNIQNDEYFSVSSQVTKLPIGPDTYLKKVTKKDILNSEVAGTIYAKNSQLMGMNQAVHLWVADYSGAPNNEFSYFAERDWTKDLSGKALGIKRLGVLRADVDDLGFGFMAGFSHQGDGKYNTLSRTATFSRNMSVFFKLYINQFADDKKLTIIYSGGDDVFVLGAWDEIIDFTVELRENFLRWTNYKLTLSAGVGMFPDKVPVNIMARQTGELEDAAKANDKDSICLFDVNCTFKFDTFIEEVQGNYFYMIQKYFNNQDERGKSFIYRLLQLIAERDEQDRIAFARLAYTLARMEDLEKNAVLFGEFKTMVKEAFENTAEIMKFETALRLYLYESRKDGN